MSLSEPQPRSISKTPVFTRRRQGLRGVAPRGSSMFSTAYRDSHLAHSCPPRISFTTLGHAAAPAREALLGAPHLTDVARDLRLRPLRYLQRCLIRADLLGRILADEWEWVAAQPDSSLAQQLSG
jgi:hypothetical protein